MKTIREWLETLDEPYRTKAINNAEREGELYSMNCLDKVRKEDLSKALCTAFFWSKSPEGHDYWDYLLQKL